MNARRLFGQPAVRGVLRRGRTAGVVDRFYWSSGRGFVGRQRYDQEGGQRHVLIAARCKSLSLRPLTTQGHPEAPSEARASPEWRVTYREADFFGEAVTFLQRVESHADKQATHIVGDAVQAVGLMDAFMLAVVSKGYTSEGDSKQFDFQLQGAHALATEWSALLRMAHQFNSAEASLAAPMLAVAAVAPLLAQTETAYARHLDNIMKAVTATPDRSIGFLPLAHHAVAHLDSSPHGTEDPAQALSLRERFHLMALRYFLEDRPSQALGALCKALQLCPGDVLALSLAIDVASRLGRSDAALRAATSVASYWAERGRGSLNLGTAIPGHTIASSLVAVGLAVGGRHREAEHMAERILHVDADGGGGVVAWALASVYEAQGRVSEGRSLLSGYDGVRRYEPCNFFFFQSRLATLGARFTLDRDRAEDGRAVLRIYQTNVTDIARDLCNITSVQQPHIPRTVPRPPPKATVAQQTTSAASSIFGTLFSSASSSSSSASSSLENAKASPAVAASEDERTVDKTLEDALTWLPPTPQFLTDATMLLLRLTLAGVLDVSDQRWPLLRNYWRHYSQIVGADAPESATTATRSMSFPLQFPLAALACAMLMDPTDFLQMQAAMKRRQEDFHPLFLQVQTSCHTFGQLLGLTSGVRPTAAEENSKQWSDVVEGLSLLRDLPCAVAFPADLRPLTEQAICFAACMARDHQSLCHARAVCSEAVTLRPNSPEVWYRYSVILERLGDATAAEEAKAASVSLGAGEGGSGAH